MARLAFFSEMLPPDNDPVVDFAYDLIKSLADQGHQIRLFATYRAGAELPAAHSQIELLRPFRSWGWLEVPRVLPLVIDFRPEILHFIQPRAEALRGFSNAMTALASAAPMMGRPPVVTSLYDFGQKDLPSYRSLLHLSRVITVSNQPQLNSIRNLLYGSRRRAQTQTSPQVEILPPTSAPAMTEFAFAGDSAAISTHGQPWSDTFASDRAVVFIPGDVGVHSDVEMLFQEMTRFLVQTPNAVVVMGGGWGRLQSTRQRHRLMKTLALQNVDNRFLLTGPLSDRLERQAFASARLIFTASLPPESLSLAKWLREGLAVGVPLVIGAQQAAHDTLQWKHGENALISSSGSHGWSDTLIAGLNSASILERIRKHLPEFSRVETVDHPSNVMSRIYARIINRGLMSKAHTTS